MDNIFQLQRFDGNFPLSATFERPITGHPVSNDKMDTTLRLDSPGASCLFGSNTKGTKRKWDFVEGTEGSEDGFSLVLGLGRSPSSSDNSKMSSATVCTMSSAKETDEETSMDVELNFQLHLGSDGTPSPTKPAVGSKNLLDARHVFDLQLSLSTGPPTSAVTSVGLSHIHHEDTLETSVSINVLPSSTATKVVDSCFLSSTISDVANSAVAAPNLSSTAISAQKGAVSCASGIANIQQQRNLGGKTCQFRGCGKGARGASGLCIAHGGGRRCHKEGCNKGAEGRTIYCKAHGGGRRCQFLGCTKSAEGRTDYCIAHGGGRRCSHEGCSRASRGKSGLCIRHGGGKRCQKENCTKSAEGYSGLCISHGGGRRCQFPACTKGAQGSTMFCKAHGGGKRCTVLGCMKGAEGSTSFCKGHGGGKRCSFQGGGICPKSVHGGTQFCVAHGGGKRCAVPDCTKSARGRTDYCVRHGGGKRCQIEGCSKSAQGRTDFCKAHGGGKRCSWGQAGSDFGAGGLPCDRFARGKTGLCAAHSALVQDHRVHGGGTLGPEFNQSAEVFAYDKMKSVVIDEDIHAELGNRQESFVGWNSSNSSFVHQPIPQQSSALKIPEGRVHGGRILALLATGTGGGSYTRSQIGTGPSGQGTAHSSPHNWI